jgi:hypothetical protein
MKKLLILLILCAAMMASTDEKQLSIYGCADIKPTAYGNMGTVCKVFDSETKTHFLVGVGSSYHIEILQIK